MVVFFVFVFNNHFVFWIIESDQTCQFRLLQCISPISECLFLLFSWGGGGREGWRETGNCLTLYAVLKKQLHLFQGLHSGKPTKKKQKYRRAGKKSTNLTDRKHMYSVGDKLRRRHPQ